MIINRAMEILTQYSHSLEYKIDQAAPDPKRIADILIYQRLLTECDVYYFLLKSMVFDAPNMLIAQIPEPFPKLLAELKKQLLKLSVKPLNNLTPPTSKRLQETPYYDFAQQLLNNMCEKKNRTLFMAVLRVKNLMLPDPLYPPVLHKSRARNANSRLTPCLVLAYAKRIPEFSFHTIEPNLFKKAKHLLTEIQTESEVPYLLTPRPPVTIKDLALMLAQYAVGAFRAFPSEEIHLNLEINYSILMQHCEQKLLNENDPANTYLLFDALLQQMTDLRKKGIARAVDITAYEPLERSHNKILQEKAKESLGDILQYCHSQFVLLFRNGEAHLANQYENMSDVTRIILLKITGELDCFFELDDDAGEYLPICNTRC